MKTVPKTSLAFFLGLSLYSAASAQDVRSASEGVLACQDIAEPMEKLACFEAAAAQMSEAMAQPAPIAVVEPTSVIVAAPAPVVAAAATPPAVTTAAVEVPVTPQKRRLLPSWIPSVSFKRDSDGEQVKQPRAFPITITRIQRNKLGRHFFTTSDGQVWRQVQVEDIKAPTSIPVGGVLKRGFGSAIRMRYDGDRGQSISVVRVE